MKTLFLMVGALSLVAIAGCRGPRSGIPEGAKVAVLEFRIPETANITRYSASYNDLGMIVAQQLAEELRSRHRDAEAIPSGAPVHADLVVSGDITRIDGGNRALRVLIGMGAGGSSCAVTGQVTRPSGPRLGVFTEAAKRKSTGWFWMRYGESSRRQIEECLHAVGASAAVAIDDGRLRPATDASAASPGQAAVKRTAEERLHELDELHEKGLLTDEEYKEKRRRIIEEF